MNVSFQPVPVPKVGLYLNESKFLDPLQVKSLGKDGYTDESGAIKYNDIKLIGDQIPS